MVVFRVTYFRLFPMTLTEAGMKEAAEMTVSGEAKMTVHNPVYTPENMPCTDLNEDRSSVDVSPDKYNSLQLNLNQNKPLQNKDLWARLDSNQRPADYESDALTN